jgi:hypothetical protein
VPKERLRMARIPGELSGSAWIKSQNNRTATALHFAPECRRIAQALGAREDTVRLRRSAFINTGSKP